MACHQTGAGQFGELQDVAHGDHRGHAPSLAGAPPPCTVRPGARAARRRHQHRRRSGRSATGPARRRGLSVIETNSETKEMLMETIAAPMATEKRVAAAGYLDDVLVDLITLSLNAK